MEEHSSEIQSKNDAIEKLIEDHREQAHLNETEFQYQLDKLYNNHLSEMKIKADQIREMQDQMDENIEKASENAKKNLLAIHQDEIEKLKKAHQHEIGELNE